MKRLAVLLERLEVARTGEDRFEAMRAYFADAPAPDAEHAASLLAGERLDRACSADELSAWALEAAAVPGWLLDESREVTGDKLEALALLFPEAATRAGDDLSLDVWIRERILPLRRRDAAERRAAVLAWWEELDRPRRFLLAKLLTGSQLARIARALIASARGAEPGAQTPAPLAPAAHTLDLVLVYAEPAPNRRQSQLTHLTLAARDGDALVPVAKTSDGLGDDELRRLDKWIRSHATARYGPVRHVPPEHVFTVGFEAIERSARHKSGVALRGARIIGWREGTPSAEAATLETVRALLPA